MVGGRGAEHVLRNCDVNSYQEADHAGGDGVFLEYNESGDAQAEVGEVAGPVLDKAIEVSNLETKKRAIFWSWLLVSWEGKWIKEKIAHVIGIGALYRALPLPSLKSLYY